MSSFASTFVFVDAGIAGADQLLAALAGQPNVYTIPAGVDGLAYIASVLGAAAEPVAAVHVLSHGAPGMVQLGALSLTEADIAARDADMAAIRAAMAPGADLMLYGCEAGAGDAGAAFIAALAAATGADVAASTDLTGAAGLGGNWTLEAATGAIEAETLALESYQGTLLPGGYISVGGGTFFEDTQSSRLTYDATVILDGNVAGGSLTLAINAPMTDEVMGFAEAGSPSFMHGVITVVDGTVYRGDGDGARVLGTVDPILDGTDGTLRINFAAGPTPIPLQNGDFNAGVDGVNMPVGWSIYTGPFSTSVPILGYLPPQDPTYPASNETGDSGSHGVVIEPGFYFGTGEALQDAAVFLDSGIATEAPSFGVVRGPVLFSDNALDLSDGDTVTVRWAAESNADTYDVFGYLLNADTGDTHIILNATGTTTGDSVGWTETTFTMPLGTSSGDWRVVLVGGSYDSNGDGTLGATLAVDEVLVQSAGATITAEDVEAILESVDYSNPADAFPSTFRYVDVTLADSEGIVAQTNSSIYVYEVNDAPIMGGTVALPGLIEDAAAGSGSTILSLLESSFYDPDAGSLPSSTMFGGIAVVSNTTLLANGVWQYSLTGDTWQDIGTASLFTALLLPSTASLRFVPAENFYGSPDALVVHGIDTSWVSGYTDSETKYYTSLLGQTGLETSFVSSGAALITVEVTAVPDAPQFVSDPYMATMYDGPDYEVFPVLSGTFEAVDPDQPGGLTFSIVDGVDGGETSQISTPLGTLSVVKATGAWTFTPDRNAVNALGEGEVPSYTITIRVTDGDGEIAEQTYTIAANGANDTPSVPGQLVFAPEAHGVNNSTDTEPTTGNLLSLATERDAGQTLEITSVSFGITTVDAPGDTGFVIAGNYGTLTVQTDGSFSYAVNNDDPDVNAMQTGFVLESFAFSVSDGEGGTAVSALLVRIDASDDLLTVTSTVADTLQVEEDTPTPVDLSGLVFLDPDGQAEPTNFGLVFSTQNGTLQAWDAEMGVMVHGSGTSELTVTGLPEAISNWIAAATQLHLLTYIPDSEGSTADVINIGWRETDEGESNPIDTIAVTILADDDAPVVDAGGATPQQGSLIYQEVAVVRLLPAAEAQVIEFDGTTITIAAGSTVQDIAIAFMLTYMPNWYVGAWDAQSMYLTARTPGDKPDLTAADFTDGNGGPSPLVRTTEGFGALATFQARGEAVAIAPRLTLSDVDSDTLSSATVTLADGVFDNQFGTHHETLALSAEGQTLATDAGITVQVATSASGATLTLTGAASIAAYQAVLQQVVYENANPNAYAGTRTATISVTDDTGVVSGTNTLVLAEANSAVEVGQQIWLNGHDTGTRVAEILDARHFVASGALEGLADGMAVSFRDGVHEVASGIAAAPFGTVVDIDVIWTPVIDLNGTGEGTEHAVSYIEQAPAVAVATADARITDQGGLIRILTVTLVDTLNNTCYETEEFLSLSSVMIDWLGARGVTVAANNGEFDLSGNLTKATVVNLLAAEGASATVFQTALRGFTYQNLSDAPGEGARNVIVQAVDTDGNYGLDSRTVINLTPVNDAPIALDSSATGIEDAGHVFTLDDFGFSDETDGGAHGVASVIIDTLPEDGLLELDGVAVTAGTEVSVADIEAGKLVFTDSADVHGEAVASFTFRVRDDGGTANGGTDTATDAATLTINLAAVNDAPVLTMGDTTAATISEDDFDTAGQAVADLIGTVTDIDTGASGPGNGTLQGMAIHSASIEGGHWEYNAAEGGWSAISLQPGEVLLLGPDDRVRFVPDGENATSATLGYYAWDGATGTAGTTAGGIAGDDNTAHRGGTSAYSVGSGTVSLTVTGANDAPDVSGETDATFYARGEAVAVFAPGDVTLSDVDTGASLTGATVVLQPFTTLDNAFGTTYETLFSAAGATITTTGGATITVSGNGTAESPLVLTGAGSFADYTEALETLRYQNTNPNLSAGPRAVVVSVTDDTGADSDPATFVIHAEWATVVDLDGSASDGRDHAVTWTEDGPGVAIAASDAELIDQDGNTRSVTITLSDTVNGEAEGLFIDPDLLPVFEQLGITIDGLGTHAVTLTSVLGLDPTYFQMALRSVVYDNTSDAPTDAARTVRVETVDADGHPGVGAQTVINVVKVNDAPTGSLTIVNDTDSGSGPRAGDTLRVVDMLGDPDGLPDGWPDGAVYEWLQGDTVVHTGPTLALTKWDVGATFSVRVSWTDAEGTPETVTSEPTSAVVNVNAAPVADDPAPTATMNEDDATGVNYNLLDAVDDEDLAYNLDTLTIADIRYTVNGTPTDNDGTTPPAGVSVTGGVVTVEPTAFQYLGANDADVILLRYTVRDTSDAEVEQTFTITVTGANDGATITGSATAALTEDGQIEAHGSLSVDDPDMSQATFHDVADGDLVGTYGQFTFDAGTGAWTYLLDNTGVQVQGLGAGEEVTDTLTVTSVDGTATETITVTITGTNDVAEIDGTNTATVSEDATEPVGGTLVLSDADDGEAVYAEPALFDLVGNWGTFAFDAAQGIWSYTVDTASAAVQGLTDGDERTDTLTVVSQDGTASAPITVTITGANDAPTDIALSNATVAENTAAGLGRVVGTLSATDPDAGDTASFTIVGGADSYAFQLVDGTTLKLIDGITLDAEVKSSYEVTIRATDSRDATYDETLTITIGDVNEHGVTRPTFDVTPMPGASAPNTIPHLSAVGSFVGVRAVATDADLTNSTVTYALVADAAGTGPYTTGTFRIDAVTGEIFVAGLIDIAGGSLRTLHVQATSSDGSSQISALNLVIEPANPNPGLGPNIYGTDGADTLVGTNLDEWIGGSHGDDYLLGSGGNDTLNGQSGNDTTEGGLGNDWHYVDSAGDVVIEHAGQGTADRVLASVSYVLASGVSVEILTTNTPTGTQAINLTGNEVSQSVIGNAGANWLKGMGGNDVLRGLGGNDTLDGGAGNDVLVGGSGADTFVFANNWGKDRIADFQLSVQGEVIDLSRVSGITDFADLQDNHLSEVGGDAVITVNRSSIVLTGVSMDSLTVDHFIF